MRWMSARRSEDGRVDTQLQSVPAQYFDGQTAQGRDVEISLTQGVVAGAGVLVVTDATQEVARWDLDRMRAMRDQDHAASMTLMPYPDATERLIITDPDAKATLRKVAPNLMAYRADKTVLRRIAIWAGGAIASIALIIFVIVPAIADQLAVLIPPERERKLGDAAIGQITWVLGQMGDEVSFCTEPKGLAALRRMEGRLAAQFESPVPITLRVIDHKLENAFAVPGGHIVIFDGLLRKASSAEEIAGVVGHEMGHVVYRDPTRLALRSASTAGMLGLLLGDFTGGTVVLLVTERLIAASYAQDAEAAADAFSYRVMADAGLPTRPLGDFFDRMAEQVGESSGLLSHLASHPDIRARADEARAADVIGNRQFEPVLTSAEWADLQAICSDPTQGDVKNAIE